jgi:hypothetical protein
MALVICCTAVCHEAYPFTFPNHKLRLMNAYLQSKHMGTVYS